VVERIHWEDLPRGTREAIERHTGIVSSARTVSEGFNSAIAAVLTTETGSVFVKGLHREHRRRGTQDMEALINPYAARVSPRLLWRVEGEWDVLGFEVVDGRHADYRPGSPDLAKIAGTMAELGTLRCPDLPVKPAEDVWRTYVNGPGELDWLKGDRLLHTDYSPLNVLITRDRAFLVDWAWPTRGAGWIAPACMVLRLMANGHSAESAERVFADVPAWYEAPADGLMVFARASARRWAEIPDAGAPQWAQDMKKAARAWMEHRALR
jgi:hypothetical protein